MEFKEFLEQVQDRIPDYLLQFNIDSIRLERVLKNNGVVCTGLVIGLEGENVSPNIYMEYYYSLVKKGEAMEKVLEAIASEYKTARQRMEVQEQFELDKNKLKDRVFLRLVNYEKNKELLEDCPYIPFNDLAITFRYLVNINDEGISSALINNQELKLWEVNLEYLMKYARENTLRLFPPMIRSMKEMLSEMCSFVGELPENPTIYVLSNKQCINGATCLIFKEVLEDFAKKLKTDFYILPSSIHEVLLVPIKEVWNRDELLELVRNVNENVLEQMDFLSDNIYIYDRTKGAVYI